MPLHFRGSAEYQFIILPQIFYWFLIRVAFPVAFHFHSFGLIKNTAPPAPSTGRVFWQVSSSVPHHFSGFRPSIVIINRSRGAGNRMVRGLVRLNHINVVTTFRWSRDRYGSKTNTGGAKARNAYC